MERGDMTSALTAVRNGVGVLIQPSLTASASLRLCVSAWSLADMVSAYGHSPFMAGDIESP